MPLSFSHIGINVTDLDAMRDFYTSRLGFFVTDRGHLVAPDGSRRELVFMSRNPDEHHQIVLATGRPADLAFSVINQISLRADSLATLKEIHRGFLAEGRTDLQCLTHGNALSLYVPDPEGNKVELFIDTPWYVTQPMRVPVDLARPDDAILRDAENHARSLPGFRPRSEWRAEMAKLMGLA